MSTATSDASIIRIENLNVTFTGGNAPVRAVNGVSLSVARGETVALIGESGSGKSVTLRSLLRLHPPKKTQISGTMQVAGRDVLALSSSQLAKFRGETVSMVFQEPLLALDPVYSVGDQIIESIQRHKALSRAEANQKALSLFEQVRIPSPERRLAAYPHEMSGGMRQRAMIALALACDPEVLLADEPTTALDATVQIQILLLMRELQAKRGLSIVFVTHDIGAAVEVADRIAVMYAGQIVEEGDVRTIMRSPRHPYTRALMQSRAHGSLAKGERLAAIPGAPPDLANLPSGCAFAPRCAYAEAACRESAIAIVPIGETHRARCRRTDVTHLAPAPTVEA